MALKLFPRMSAWIKVHFPVVSAIVVLLLLLAKNPFSERTLIPNFDPFPDTFHYVVPPRCFLQGEGWKLCREGFEGIKPAVPPLYSVTMLPLLLLNNDPRMFYFSNILLSISGLLLFYAILRQLTKNQLILGLTLFFYVTNYFIYWYPTLAMAENAILPLFLLATYLVVKNLKQFNLIQVLSLCATAVAFYFVKPAYAPLTIVFSGWESFLLLKQWPKLSTQIKRAFAFIASSLLLIILIVEGEQVGWAFQQILNSKPTSQGIDNWFSVAFMKDHILTYLGTLIGKPMPFLWDKTPMLTQWLAVCSLVGLACFFVRKSGRLVGLVLLSTLVFQMTFIASFYAVDARYIYHVIPVLLIGFAYGLETARRMAKTPTHKTLFVGLLALLGGLYLFQNALLLKSQIMLNLKYAEQPWWYLSVRDISRYFETVPSTDKKPFLIVAHPPFLFDFYGNDKYALLPLTQMQDFRNESRVRLWGNYDYSDYQKLYSSLLKQGYPIYVTNYGLGNDKGYHEDFKMIQDNFDVQLVQTGCYNLCNVYTVNSKE
jgi:hypothetical protein